MNDQKRFILAIALTVAILAAFSFFNKKPQIDTQALVDKQSGEKRVAVEKAAGQPTAGVLSVPAKSSDKKVVETEIETACFKVVLTDRGGCIKELYVKKPAKNDPPIKLLCVAEPDQGSLRIEKLMGLPAASAVYELTNLTSNTATYVYEEKNNYRVEKKFIFPNSNYNIELEISIKNLSKGDKGVSYMLSGPSGIDRSLPLDKRFTNIGSFADGVLRWQRLGEVKSLGKKGSEFDVAGQNEWFILRNTHFSTIITPYQKISCGYMRWLGEDKIQGDRWSVGIKTGEFIVAQGGDIIHKYTLYAGPTSLKHLKPLGLAKAFNYGKLNFFCQPLVKILDFFYRLSHNYGLAIILLVVLIGLCTFPLTLKNVKSMKQMQAVQPHLARLKELHKDDQQKLQAEMMKFYREHKVNPMGGCLPMLLQMPIFMSLYITLARSPELAGSNFLWIKDLSQPDALFPFPAKLPILGDSFNLLPLLMIGAMVLQQKITTKTKSTERVAGDEQQRQQQNMMLLMPVIFGFMFYNLPSGLVLYWTANTLLMAATHHLIQKRLADNGALTISPSQAGV
ncbi:MAG: membrane protein insertase YidC [Candidatus Omnitrophica bacterium]|nr:membrane protein insertase YidC [Candidatus Omnitrophota bacterium]